MAGGAVANYNKGPEDIRKPFGKRRHVPGTNAGQYTTGYSEVSFAMMKAKNLLEAARIAINRFGVPRRIVTLVLRDPKRNNMKLMRLVELSKQYQGRKAHRAAGTRARVGGGKRGAEALKRFLDRG